MGKAPALAECMFCEKLPCQCAKNRAAARRAASKPLKVAKPTKPVEQPDTDQLAPIEPPANHAPVASRRRFDARSAMAAEAATEAGSVTVSPVSVPVPPEPVTPLLFRPTMAPRTVQAKPAQVESGSSAIMAYAEHLVKVALGGVPVDQPSGVNALAARAAEIRARFGR